MKNSSNSYPDLGTFASKELEALIIRAKNGDKESFSLLYSELYSPLFRFVKSRTGDHDRALDICQETFLKWYKTFESYEIRMKPLSYLMMISMRLIINDSKKTKPVNLSEELEEILKDEDLTPADLKFDENIEYDRVKKLISNLSDSQQNVLTMRYVADADTETIAEALDLTHSNVRKIESRAIQRIRTLYNSMYKRN